ncbi:NADPH oxidase organizer 1-like [Cololabis saira]|uniref:NADPH oxidase organizer 1-like n=1 Tax=Cololabis saira TaxID=129043 RepID=UPI002AD334E8|nr:NADPH oxidase organizer 1-like [Cololabis saira]
MSGDQRNVLSARIVGGVRRDKPKLKMFMVSVLWSDETEVIIYRSFQDFKKFHRELKKRFPNFNPLRKNDERMIPKFSGKARRNSLQQKGSRKSVRQMKFLDSYSDKLLKCDLTVTQSSEVRRFFTPKDHDMQQDFTKNTVMIFMSEDVPGVGAGDATARHFAGNVTHPFVTQTYRCVAAYETKDTKNRPFKVAMDEKLEVLIKDPAGWWLVENEDKRLAWFPAPYLELLDGEEEDDVGSMGGALYCAVKSYTSKKNDEVSAPIGSVVEVLRKSDDGWWLIRFSGKVGYIPSMYLQPYNNPRAGLYGLHRKMLGSSLNLASGRDPQPSYQPRVSDEKHPGQDCPGPSSLEASVPARIHKAQSLDVLSESWLPTQTEAEASTSDSRGRSLSRDSTESMFSDFSSSSGDSSRLKEVGQSPTGYSTAADGCDSSGDRPDHSLYDRRISHTSSNSSGSAGSKTSETLPKIPPRPKTEEILNRCTTMTRKAALAASENLHSRL